MNSKKIFTALLITINFSIYFSQNKYGKIIYELNTTNDKILNGGGTLYFDNNSSLYILQAVKKEVTTIRIEGDGTIIHPSNTIDSLANKTRFIYYDRDKNLFYNNIINNNTETLIKDNIKIEWQITNEKKNILGYKCRKATGKLNGNNYSVWFTEKIQYPYGPIKINGLNGMILEVHNETLDMRILAKEIFLDTENTSQFISNFNKNYDFSSTQSREEYNDFLNHQLKKSLE